MGLAGGQACLCRVRRGFLLRAGRGGSVVGVEGGRRGRRRRTLTYRTFLLAEASTDLDSGGEEKRGRGKGLGVEFSTEPEVVGRGIRSS